MTKPIETIIFFMFTLLVLYGTYVESRKQYELYLHNSNLMKQGTITQTNDFYRTGMQGDVLGFEYYNQMSQKIEHGATWDMGNVGEVIKRESIKVIYIQEADHYRSKFYDQVVSEMNPWHIVIQSLFYIILVLSVILPLLAMEWIRQRIF